VALLEIRNVTRRFGGIVALDDVSFDVPEGEVAGLGSLWGLAAGAALIEFLPVKTPDIVNGLNWLLYTGIDPKTAGVSDAIFGAVLVLVMLLFPRGVAGALRALYSRLG
jgi:branched-chain amino acid transport system permease protein